MKTFKALKQISKYPFSIALFGAGYLHETNEGIKDSRFSIVNEQRFWNGRNLVLIADSSGKAYPRYILRDSDNESEEQRKRYQHDWNAKYTRGNWK